MKMDPSNKQNYTSLDGWASISEKTIFLLDRNNYFTQVSSGHSIDGDGLKDNKKNAQIYDKYPPIKPLDRSLWTCTVEAVVGYSRLVWDLFTPAQRCISILAIVPDSQQASKHQQAQQSQTQTEPTYVETIYKWNENDRSLNQLMENLAKNVHKHPVSFKKRLIPAQEISTSLTEITASSSTLTNSLNEALNQMCLLTLGQSKQLISKLAVLKSSLTDRQIKYDEYAKLLKNNGRIILISTFANEQAVKNLINKFEQMLAMKNASLKEKSRSLDSTVASILKIIPINYCDLIVINTYALDHDNRGADIKNFDEFRPNLHVQVFSVKSGTYIAGLLNNLCLQHHNLKSTTITGIPMKEEQNASSSSQYDVEIVHCSSVHDEIMNSGSPLLEDVVGVIDRKGFPCDTFKLHWCSPRTLPNELHHCVATSRLTSVDVNSRPSTCLTNFLLTGRTVMLEIFKSKSNRMTTHLLASHNGELYIHTLLTHNQKLNLDDPPSLTEGIGGKVPDYRINDFVEFMKQNTLVPYNQSLHDKEELLIDPLGKACNLLKRQTLYWPLTIGHTILLNIQKIIGPLVKLVPLESLDPSEVDECKKAISDLLSAEGEGAGLPSVTISNLMKVQPGRNNISKLDHLYKLLYNELEYFLRIHSTTLEHESLIEYLLDQKSGDKRPIGRRGNKRAVSKVLKAPMAKVTPPKKPKQSSKLIPTINSSLSIYYKTGMSLLQTWTQLNDLSSKDKRRPEFVGRAQGSVAKLYTHLQI